MLANGKVQTFSLLNYPETPGREEQERLPWEASEMQEALGTCVHFLIAQNKSFPGSIKLKAFCIRSPILKTFN